MTTCPRCNQPIDPTQPTATMTVWAIEFRLHAHCGREWQAERRQQLIDSVRFADKLAASVRSLRIVPAQETADDDGLRVVDGVCVGGWAF